MKRMRKLALKILLQLHTSLYKCIGRIAVLENKGIHPKHTLTNYSEFFLKNIKENDTVLDIGCGIGMIEKVLAKKAKHIVAIDINESSINAAKNLNTFPNVKYVAADAKDYDFGRNFDVAILSNVLEHIENRAEFLGRIGNITKKILVRVPMLDRDWITLYKRQLGLEYRLDKTHKIEYTIADFQKEMQECGLSIESFYIKFGEIYAVVKT